MWLKPNGVCHVPLHSTNLGTLNNVIFLRTESDWIIDYILMTTIIQIEVALHGIHRLDTLVESQISLLAATPLTNGMPCAKLSVCRMNLPLLWTNFLLENSNECFDYSIVSIL